MNPNFLDVFGADFASGILWLFFIIIALIILVETPVMILMKYNIRFKKALSDSVLVNLASLGVGFILIYLGLNFSNSLLNLLLFYAITVLVEFGILYLLNRRHRVAKTFVVCMVMNLVSYIILFSITLA